ncbi:hypothetical protein CP10139811_0095 [Chlamydia ibidis]|uniref:Uncharacterized protein n=1 Tax=Chlamydia ibidis TaxID=1405396 RepID=S7KMM3_9CHLA|nr:hypothetical protein CP10139811_0095 [Chlamydia ibidis]
MVSTFPYDKKEKKERLSGLPESDPEDEILKNKKKFNIFFAQRMLQSSSCNERLAFKIYKILPILIATQRVQFAEKQRK